MDKIYFQKIYNYVRQPQYYISQNHSSIGGFWASDIYKRDNIIVKLLDEGSSRQIITADLDLIQNYHDELLFYKGDSEILKELYQRLYD